MSIAPTQTSGTLAGRLARRELRAGRARYLLAGTVILLAIAAAVVADTLVRSAQLGAVAT